MLLYHHIAMGLVSVMVPDIVLLRQRALSFAVLDLLSYTSWITILSRNSITRTDVLSHLR